MHDICTVKDLMEKKCRTAEPALEQTQLRGPSSFPNSEPSIPAPPASAGRWKVPSLPG